MGQDRHSNTKPYGQSCLFSMKPMEKDTFLCVLCHTVAVSGVVAEAEANQ